MRELKRIQKRGNLNKVYASDRPGVGGASHNYTILYGGVPLLEIDFQKGGRGEPGSELGVIDPDLLEIVRDRLTAFAAGPFSSPETEEALAHVEKALEALNTRVQERTKRGVMGKHEK